MPTSTSRNQGWHGDRPGRALTPVDRAGRDDLAGRHAANARGRAPRGPPPPGPPPSSMTSWQGGRRSVRADRAARLARPVGRRVPAPRGQVDVRRRRRFGRRSPPASRAGTRPADAARPGKAHPLPRARPETPPGQRLAVEAVDEEPVPDQQAHLEFGAARRQAAEEVGRGSRPRAGSSTRSALMSQPRTNTLRRARSSASAKAAK